MPVSMRFKPDQPGTGRGHPHRRNPGNFGPR